MNGDPIRDPANWQMSYKLDGSTQWIEALAPIKIDVAGNPPVVSVAFQVVAEAKDIKCVKGVFRQAHILSIIGDTSESSLFGCSNGVGVVRVRQSVLRQICERIDKRQ